MPSLTRLVGVIAAKRLAKEDAGYQRLLKAVFAPEITVEQVNSAQFGQPLIEQLPDPPLHPYSCVWALVENDPAKWQ